MFLSLLNPQLLKLDLEGSGFSINIWGQKKKKKEKKKEVGLPYNAIFCPGEQNLKLKN